MHCVNCGTPVSPELNYCNRCGFNVRESGTPNTALVTASISAITLVAVAGLAVMFFAAVFLKKSGFTQDFIGFFLFFSFLLVSLAELFLFRNLTKLADLKQQKPRVLSPPITNDLRLPQASPLGEPVGSVTDQTTRTLEYVQRDQ